MLLARLSARFRNQHIPAMSHCFRPPGSLGIELRSKAGKGGMSVFPGGRLGGGGPAPAQTKAAVGTACSPLAGMLRKLDIKSEDDVKSLSRVMAHVFSDGVTNWGRIVTLISFGAFVAKHLKSINQESCIDPLAESITDVLVRTKRDWLVKQRGWVSWLWRSSGRPGVEMGRRV